MIDLAKRSVALLTVLAFIFGPAMSLNVSAQTPAPSSVPNIEFEKYTLPNGLEVILHVDRKLPEIVRDA